MLIDKAGGGAENYWLSNDSQRDDMKLVEGYGGVSAV